MLEGGEVIQGGRLEDGSDAAKELAQLQISDKKGAGGGFKLSDLLGIARFMGPNAQQESDAISAQSGLNAVNQIRTILSSKGGDTARRLWQTGLVGRTIGGKPTRQYADAAREAFDVITRTRTGAALNLDEQKFYATYIPFLTDDKQTSDLKLQRLENIYQKVIKAGTPINIFDWLGATDLLEDTGLDLPASFKPE